MDAIEAISLVNRIYRRLAARRDGIQQAEDYYNGNQKLNYATAEWMKQNAARYSGFSDNWSATVPNAENERLKHTGLRISDQGAASRIWDQWLRNEMEAQSSQGFLQSLIARRSYVIVWSDGDDGVEQSWEHPANVEIEYDFSNLRRRAAALKTWVDEDTEFATLYTPDSVWKFKRSRQVALDDRQAQSLQATTGFASDGGWVPRLTDEVWPLPNPLGVVPVVEVPNRPTLRGEPVSEIAGVIPMQDAINLLWAYLFLAADYASLPARVATGAEPPKMPIIDKETGEIIGERPVDMKDLAEKRLLFLQGDNAKADQWDAARLDVFVDTIETAVGHIAAQTRTPPHYLVSNKGLSNLSGDALKSAEIGLTKKAGEFATFASPSMREIHRLTALVLGEDSTAAQIQTARMTWANPEIRSDAQLADALLKKRQMGYPFAYIMELDGIDPSEQQRILEMIRAEQSDPWMAQMERPLNDSEGSSGPVSAAAAGVVGDDAPADDAVGASR